MVTYKIQVYPSSVIGAYIQESKAQILEEFGQYRFYTTQPHITLFSFLSEIGHEHFVRKALKEAAAFVDPFKVALDGFSYFNQERMIYMNISNGSQVGAVNHHFYQKFMEVAARLGVMVENPVVAEKPHMPVGSDFEQKAFLKVFQTFVEQGYRQTFDVNEVLLLRDLGNSKNDLVETVSLQAQSAVSLKWPEEKDWMVGEPQMPLFSYVA